MTNYAMLKELCDMLRYEISQRRFFSKNQCDILEENEAFFRNQAEDLEKVDRYEDSIKKELVK
jgi:ClpP class serine protease